MIEVNNDAFLNYAVSAETLTGKDVQPEDISPYLEKCDTYAHRIWASVGYSGFENGLWWLVDPSLYTPMFEKSLKGFKNPVVIGRTAFGDIIFISDKNKVSVLNMRLRQIVFNQEILSFFFNVLLLDEDFLNEILDKKLFIEVTSDKGPLQQDECFGYFPPLFMGGDANPKNLQKVKLFEHLMLLQS